MLKPLLARLTDVGLNRIAEMDAAEVTVQVLSAAGAGADRLEGGRGLELARSYNRPARDPYFSTSAAIPGLRAYSTA
jgi:hypothetical protein